MVTGDEVYGADPMLRAQIEVLGLLFGVAPTRWPDG